MNRESMIVKSLFKAALASICFVALTLGLSRVGSAGGGPENVLVVVNEDSESSLLIANHYIELRNIPSQNVVYLKGIPFKETIDFRTFEQRILRPILIQIEDRKLAGSIDYIVYSSDFPTAIRIRSLVKEFFEKQKIQDDDKKFFNAEASINALTYFAARSIHAPYTVFELRSNRYYRVGNQQMLRRPFDGPLQKEFQRSIDAFEKPVEDPLFESAVDSLQQMIKRNPGQTALLYWLAKFAAKQGDETAATRWMTRAIGMGLADRFSIQVDPDFASVKNPVFQGLIKRMSNDGSVVTASRGFRQLYQWAPNGMLNQIPGQGERYFLSTVLAVTRNDGNTEAEALLQMKRSVEADFTNPRGVFYFTDTKDPRTNTRKSQFQDAVNALQDMGQRGEIVTSALPESKNAVLGLSSGEAVFDFGASGSTIVPGAICENLTSLGGRLGVVGGQTKLSEFLRYGAAGSMGTVTEPYAIPYKFPHAMMHVHYARGCSLAESFYQSIYGPFQTLIVGDALCQPFATQPRVAVEGVDPDEMISGIRELRFDDSDSPVRVAGMELFVDGVLRRRDGSLDPIEFDTALLSDGYHEIRVVFVAANRIETTGRVLLPVEVDNEGKRCSLQTDTPAYLIDDTLSVSVAAKGAVSIRITQNGRLLAEVPGEKGSVEIEARQLGRGPTKLRAIATIDDQEISSVPVSVRVNGPISSERVSTGKRR